MPEVAPQTQTNEGADAGYRWSRWSVLLLALPLLLYCTLPSRNFYWDGVAFSINIEKRLPAADLLHPSHLGYTLWGAWLYHACSTLGFGTRALYAMQTANGIIAGLCVLLFHQCLRLRGVPTSTSVPFTLIFAFSATWWRFAADANAYIPSIFFILLSYLLLERPKLVVPAGLILAVGLLTHELAILFLPVALVLLRANRRAMFAYTAASLIPTLPAYLVAYRSVATDPTLPGLLSWVTSHSSDSGFSFHLVTDVSLTLRGTLRLFFGGKLHDLVRDNLSYAALFALAMAFIGLLIAVWRLARAGANVTPAPRHLLLWAGIYVGFLFFWMPQNTFYRLFYLAPLVAIPAVMLRRTATVSATLWSLLAVMTFWNFAFVVYPQSRIEFNAPLHFALNQQRVWAQGTPILFRTFHPDLWTISYFNQQAAWIGFEKFDLGELDRRLRYAR